MKILSIDTSSEACSASLNIEGDCLTKFELAPQRHSSLILSMCDSLLAESSLKITQLDAIAFGQGPGSFTGLRIAAGVAQGIAFGADLPIIKVSTLAALAQQIAKDLDISNEFETVIPADNNFQIVAAIDARMQEIYWCTFNVGENGLVLPCMEEAINNPHDISLKSDASTATPVYGIGSGWDEFSELISSKIKTTRQIKIYRNRLTSAEEIGILAANKFKKGNVVSPDQAIPVYLRNNVAKKSTKIQY